MRSDLSQTLSDRISLLFWNWTLKLYVLTNSHTPDLNMVSEIRSDDFDYMVMSSATYVSPAKEVIYVALF